MAEAGKSGSSMDMLTKGVTLLSLVVATFAAWKALPVDAEIKQLQAETQRLDLALKQAEAELKAIESSRKLTFELYGEVKKLVEKKEKDPREEDALRVLVEELAEDPFRWKLLRVLAVGAASPEVKQTAAATAKFYEEEASVPARAAPAVQTSTASTSLKAMNVDAFWCDGRGSSQALAQAVMQLKPAGAAGRWRTRVLPESINRQPGYGVSVNEVRFTPPEEQAAADELVNLLAKQGVAVQKRPTSFATPGYISVFLCE